MKALEQAVLDMQRTMDAILPEVLAAYKETEMTEKGEINRA